jgi:hypothetical protein
MASISHGVKRKKPIIGRLTERMGNEIVDLGISSCKSVVETAVIAV